MTSRTPGSHPDGHDHSEPHSQTKQLRIGYQLRSLVRHPSGRFGLLLIAPVVFLAVFGRFLIQWGPLEINPADRLQGPSTRHWFGTDQLGRDFAVRIITAIPDVFLVPIGAVTLAVVVGGSAGILAGYRRGWLERILMAGTDVLLAMPALLTAILIVGIFGGGKQNMILAIGIIYIPRFARIARGSTLEVRGLPYVDAARLSGTKPLPLVIRHIVPGISSAVLVMGVLSLSTALLAQTALSFLGFGFRPPTPDLGRMLANAVPFLTIASWLAIFPAIVITLLILAFNNLGDAVRDVFDPEVARASAAL